ncbi:unnamed protein product [Linum tenue]|uniref:Uncharacterized protein n=1 Tax=Linum tenue TaxID=586396 RepID=A0AAV0PXM0_9ROSI|nr:unnamed protein product [Linum tenue]
MLLNLRSIWASILLPTTDGPPPSVSVRPSFLPAGRYMAGRREWILMMS